jgi:hypothetical protein
MTNLQDTLSKYRKDEDEANRASTSLFAEEPKKRSYIEKFKSLKDSFVKEGERKVEEGWIAQSGWNFWVVKDDEWNFVQRGQLDRFTRVWLGRGEQLVWHTEKALSPILAWIMAIFDEPVEGEEIEEGGFLQWVGKAMDFAWDKFTGAVKGWLEEWTSFTEEQKGAGRVVWWELFATAVTAWAIKWVWAVAWPTVRQAKSLTKQIGDMRISRADVQKSFETFDSKLNNQSKIFDNVAYTPDQTTAKFQELLGKIGNGDTNVSEISRIAKELKIDDTIYIKKLNDIANNNYYKSSTLTNKVGKLDIWIKEKTFNKIKTKFDELGLTKSVAKKDRALIIKKVANDFNQSDVDKALSYMERQSVSKNADTINQFLEQSKLKADWLWNEFYDTLEDSRRADLLKNMEDNGLVQKAIIDTKNWQMYSFRYTDKWVKELDWVDYRAFEWNYKGDLKASHLENGIAHYPIKKYNSVVQKIDDWKVISYAEVNWMVNELSGDVNFSAIDSLLFKKSTWTEISNEVLSSHIGKIGKRYGLKNITDEVIEKVKLWDEDAITKVVEQLEELKRNEYITIDRIKNPWKSINFATQTGVTNRLFKSLYKKVEQLPEGNVGRKLWVLKNKIDGTRKSILKKYEWDAITIKAKLKNLTSQHKAQILAIKAQHMWIGAVKEELKKNIVLIGKTGWFKWNIDAVIKKALLPKNWDGIKTPNQLKTKINQINKNIELEHTKGLIREIKDKLKKAKITKNNKWYKAWNIEIEKALQLEQAGKIFGRIKTGDLNVKDLQSLLDEIDEVNSVGKSRKLMADKEYAIEINGAIDNINWDIDKLKGTKNVENKTFKDKVLWTFSSYDNASLFANRLMEKIFGKNKMAKKHFIDDISDGYNRFEKFEIQYSDELAKNVGLIFGNNVDKIEEWWEFLYARRRLYDEKGIHFIGLDRLMNDKTSSFFRKLDVPLEDAKPKFWQEVPDEMWDELRKTELGRTMMKMDSPEFIKANQIWDKYHKLTGKMVNKTRIDIDNQFIENDEFYISFQAKRWPNAEVTAELWTKEFMNSYISPASLKKVSKEMKNWDYIWDYNPISSLYGNGRNARYYAFMQEGHKNMMTLFNGTSKSLKNLTIDELNNISQSGKYTFFKWSSKIEFGDDVLKAVDDKIDVNVEYFDANWKAIMKIETVHIDDIRARTQWIGIKDKLSDEGRYRLKKYIDRVGNGWTSITETSEKSLALMANHFNRIPLMGSLSVVLKQPLSLIDAQGRIGAKNLAQAELDLLGWKAWNVFGKNSLSNALDDVPAIHNRGGWDFLIKELRNKTPWSGWFDKMSSKYNGYVDVAMSPIKYADQWTYKKIWLWAYRESLINKKLLTSTQRVDADMIKNLDPESMRYADDIANRSASTANPLMMPQLYDRAWSKALFGIFTTQLNRLQIMFKDVPDLYKDGRKAQAMYLWASLMTANVAEYAVTIAVGKLMLELGWTTWEWYWDDWHELMSSNDALYRMTIGQTFLWSKYEWMLNPQFWPAPIIGWLTKVTKDFDEMFKDPSFETITKIPADVLGWKITQQIHTWIFK